MLTNLDSMVLSSRKLWCLLSSAWPDNRTHHRVYGLAALAFAVLAGLPWQAEGSLLSSNHRKGSSIYFEAAAMALCGVSATVLGLSLGVISTFPQSNFLCYSIPQSDYGRCGE